MDFLNYLIQSFGYNEPILTEEIRYPGYSNAWIYKELGKLVGSGQLIRFEKGIYFIPKKTSLGPSKLNPQKVIEKKYISSDNRRKGYYSGVSLLNAIGLSEQVPNTVEIFTNSEKSKVREISVGNIRVILRRARTEINNMNADTQCFLELMNSVSASFFDDEKRKIIAGYIRDCGITRSGITKYAPVFPDRAMRNLVESEVIYVIN